MIYKISWLYELIKKDYILKSNFSHLYLWSMLLELFEFEAWDQKIVKIYSKTSSNNYFYKS